MRRSGQSRIFANFSFGIGTMLLKHVFSLCDKDPQIKAVTLHVQVF